MYLKKQAILSVLNCFKFSNALHSVLLISSFKFLDVGWIVCVVRSSGLS